MRGHLKILILKMLSDKSMSGSEIISEINNLMNWRPSCGSIYPTLNTLESEGLATSELIQGKKIYSLTKKASKFLKEKDIEKQELISTMEKFHRLLESIYDIDMSSEREMLEDLKNGNMIFHELYAESKLIKDEMMRIKKSNKLEKNMDKIKKILRNTTKELKKI